MTTDTATATPNAHDFRRAVEHVRAHYPTDVFPEDGTSIDCQTAKFARGLCDRIDELAAEFAADRDQAEPADTEALRAEIDRLNTIIEDGLSVRDLELKIRDGSISVNSVFGETAGGSPVMRFFAAMMLNLLLGEDNTEPPNYRSFCFDLSPAGEPTMRFYGEVVKPGGKTSHEIRQDLETQLASRGNTET